MWVPWSQRLTTEMQLLQHKLPETSYWGVHLEYSQGHRAPQVLNPTNKKYQYYYKEN